MFVFHEGLPGSGKSYEAVAERIVPAVKAGRKVFAYIEGLNHEKIAEICGISTELCHTLLVQVDREQVPAIYDHVENDSLVVIDELQNFFPSGRLTLSDEMTKFVTEHRHRGLDIIGMGQSIADIHTLWRRRCERKMQFLKMSMVGMDDSYKWSAYQGSQNDRGEITFTKIKSGTRKYDPVYFGTYASHTSDTSNTDTYGDDRLNIFKSSAFKYGLPAAAAIGCYAIYYLVGFFSTPADVETVTAAEYVRPQIGPQNAPVAPVDAVEIPVVQTTSINGAGSFDVLFGEGYTVVLSASYAETNGTTTQYFELLDENRDTLIVFDQGQAHAMGLSLRQLGGDVWLGEIENGTKLAVTAALDKPQDGGAVQLTRIESTN